MPDNIQPETLALALHVVVMVAGVWIGAGFPDVDLRVKTLLPHRSMATHGFLLPAFLLVGSRLVRPEWAGWFAVGFSSGTALHLAFDLFPKRWRGLARVHAPAVGFCSKTESVAWLFVSVILCVGMTVFAWPAFGTLGTAACIAALAVFYLRGVWAKQEHFAAGPLLALLALAADAVRTTVTIE